MGPDELWEARARAAALFATWIADGVDARAADLGFGGFDADPDRADAARHRWLAHELLPYESVHLGPERLLGGERAALVTARYAEAGFRARADLDADHLAQELAFVGFLCGAIGDAERDGLPDVAARIRRLLDPFLAEHLGAWLPLAAFAVRDAPGWGPVLTAADDLIASFAPPLRIPAAPDVDPLASRAGLRDVGDWLATPLSTGIFWTRAALDDIGRRIGLARGFGSRAETLEALLRNAADHRKLAIVAGALAVEADRWAARHAGTPWEERARRAAAVCRTLETSAS